MVFVNELSMRNYTWFLVVALLLSACQMQKLTVDVYDPPQLEFPPDISLYLLSSRYVAATGPYEDVQWGSYESVDSVKWALSRALVDSLGSLMTNEGNYRVRIEHNIRMLRHNGGDLPEQQPWEGMISLAESRRVEAILLLEGFDIQESQIETTLSEGKYVSSFTITITTAWRSYDTRRRRLVEEAVYQWDTLFQATGSSPETTQSQLLPVMEATKQACDHAAFAYFDSFRPKKVKVERFYFPDGNEQMVKAHEAIQKGDWNVAERLWYYLAYQSPDSSILAKASFNMAMVCEHDGRLNQALAYARRSQKFKPARSTMEYINLLNTKLLAYSDHIKEKKIIRRW